MIQTCLLTVQTKISIILSAYYAGIIASSTQGYLITVTIIWINSQKTKRENVTKNVHTVGSEHERTRAVPV